MALSFAFSKTDDDKDYISQVLPIINSSVNNDEKLKALDSFLQKHSNHAPTYNNIAVLYQENGDYEKALTYYKKAIELDPQNLVFIKNLADYYFIVESDLENAMKLYIKAIEIDAEDVEVYLIIGNICTLIGNYNDARFFYDKALEIEPWNLTAMDNLDWLDEINK
ncbi:MAG TPA: tetratricopeptide repeat protein [Nitrospirae bacterium]|nr:tetratricopeptide repeat protein [Nitrospirota bacterium]